MENIYTSNSNIPSNTNTNINLSSNTNISKLAFCKNQKKTNLKIIKSRKRIKFNNHRKY